MSYTTTVPYGGPYTGCGCRPLRLPACADAYEIQTFLPTSELKAVWTDKFGLVYSQTVYTDEDGIATVPTDILPDGQTHPANGPMSLHFTPVDVPQDTVGGDYRVSVMDADGLTYPCIEVEFFVETAF